MKQLRTTLSKSPKRLSTWSQMLLRIAAWALTVKAQREATVEWIENFLESGEKLIVFAHHREPIHRLQDHFGSVAVSFTG